VRYALIDNEGELSVGDGTYEQVRAEVGPEGWDYVRLPETDGYPMWSGWVNGDGHRLGLPRNILGGLVLTGMGATVMPYAGPVVLTGWNPHGVPNEACGLDGLQTAVIRDIHNDARRALAGETGLGYPAARAIAQEMRTAPTPTITIRTISIGDFLGGRS
jgi:hypothetical protein